MKRRFDDLVTQILNGLWEEDPVEATYLGVHSYDGVLARVDSARRADYHRQRAGFLEALGEFKQRSDELDERRRIDLELLEAELEVSLRADDDFRFAERRADIYPSNALFGVYLLAMRQFAPLEQRLESIRDRLLDTPRYLREGVSNLLSGSDIPPEWTETGAQVARGGEALYSEVLPALAAEVPGLDEELKSASRTALEALESYTFFIERELQARSAGGFAVGREAFDFLLRRKHGLPYDAAQLREIGEGMIAETERLLAQTAERIDPGRSWQELVEALKDEHPHPDDIIETYRREMERARDFLLEKDLVTIPADQQLRVVETPEFERATTPYAAYVPPAAFEERQEGFYWVTPVDEHEGPRRQDQLRSHSIWGIPITSLHESYPGHHLQFSRANRLESPVRRQIMTTVFIEGWALYCEQMMEEEGFLADPRNALLRLKDQLWRACRVVVDVGLHCFGMSFEQAVELMVGTAKLERANAEVEVRRYTMSPTQPMSYLIGKREILRLRDEVRAREGDRFNLKRFHDTLLGFGAVPVSVIRGEMLAARS
jgi:uncharacterized protein (DUF885 family)